MKIRITIKEEKKFKSHKMYDPDSDDIVWLPGDIELQIESLVSSIVSLASAGYPGCIGCIDEEQWSEREWRAVVKN